MRIAFVSDAIFPYNNGGKETRLFELSTRLAKSGHDVHVYTMHWWKSPEKHRVENGVHLHAISRRYPLYAGERRSIRQGLLFSVACFNLLKARFDVVDVDHMPHFTILSMRVVAWLKRRTMFATWHEVWGSKYWQTYLGEGMGKLAGWLELLTVKLPDRIIAVSEQTADGLHNIVPTKVPVVVVSNGVNLPAVAAASKQADASDIIFAARLLENKHADVLLRAVARLHKANPEIRCFIIGDGPERASLEALTRKLKIGANVKFFGFLPEHRDVYRYMKASRVFVLPSTREGFGISVVEANACGLPAVTIDTPANAARHLITPVNGRLAKLTSADLAKQIQALLDQPPAAAAIRRTAERYDWQASAEALLREYAA